MVLQIIGSRYSTLLCGTVLTLRYCTAGALMRYCTAGVAWRYCITGAAYAVIGVYALYAWPSRVLYAKLPPKRSDRTMALSSDAERTKVVPAGRIIGATEA